MRVASPVSSSGMGSADRAREYADMLEAVDLFNGEYLKGVESPRRPMLLARLKADNARFFAHFVIRASRI